MELAPIVTDLTFVEYALEDGLLTLTLKRPPVNVLNMALLGELARVLGCAAQDASVRVLCLSGQGEKFFSAGVEVADHTSGRVAQMLPLFHQVVRQLRDFPVPVLAALNGSALGGGLELALVCDMIVAVEGAQLGQPEIRLGVFAPVAAILLPRVLPPVLANEMLLGGGAMDAAVALRHGLLNRVFPRTSFVKDVAAYLQPWLALSLAAQVHNKRALRAAEPHLFDAALAQLERCYLQDLMATEDAREGINAFLEKRAPQWRHR